MKEFKYTIDGKEYAVVIGQVSDEGVAEITVNGQPYVVVAEKPAEPEPAKPVLGQPAPEPAAAEPAAASAADAAKAVKAPLPGTITQICVEVGQEVKAGDTLVVLEAMKMANNIEAEADGRVTAICVRTGQAVLEEDALVVVE